MATYINAATAGNFATVMIRVNDGTEPTISDFLTGANAVSTGTLEIPALQDITVTNNAGTFRWKELGSLSEKVVSTVSSNSVSGNFVLDPDAFFGTDGVSPATAAEYGLFNLSNEKREVDFVVFLSGHDEDDYCFIGKGYITNVAPKVSADSPVWVSPFTIEVDGEYQAVQVPAAV